MCDSICNNEDALTTLAKIKADQKKKVLSDYLPNEDEFGILNEFCDLLEPLKEIKIILSAQKYSTISFLFPLIYTLIEETLDKIEFEYKVTENLRYLLEESLTARFNYVLYDYRAVFLAASFLDINFRKFEFINDEETRSAYLTEAINEIKTIYYSNKFFLKHISNSKASNAFEIDINKVASSTSLFSKQLNKASDDKENMVEAIILLYNFKFMSLIDNNYINITENAHIFQSN
jgi:hypothetical protein